MATKTSGFNALVAGERPVLIDFYADWCGPCKAFAPVLDRFKQEVGDSVRIIKINIDKNQPLAQQLGVQSIPTVMLYQNGELKWRALGAQSMSTMRQEVAKLANPA